MLKMAIDLLTLVHTEWCKLNMDEMHDFYAIFAMFSSYSSYFDMWKWRTYTPNNKHRNNLLTIFISSKHCARKMTKIKRKLHLNSQLNKWREDRIISIALSLQSIRFADHIYLSLFVLNSFVRLSFTAAFNCNVRCLLVSGFFFLLFFFFCFLPFFVNSFSFVPYLTVTHAYERCNARI